MFASEAHKIGGSVFGNNPWNYCLFLKEYNSCYSPLIIHRNSRSKHIPVQFKAQFANLMIAEKKSGKIRSWEKWRLDIEQYFFSSFCCIPTVLNFFIFVINLHWIFPSLQEKEKKLEGIKRLKNLKRKEIMEKLEKLKGICRICDYHY